MQGIKNFFGSWLLRSLIVVAVTLGGFWYILQIVTDTQNASIDRLADQLNASLSEIRADVRALKDEDGLMVGIAGLEEKIDRNFMATVGNEAEIRVVSDRVQDVREDLALQMKLLGQQVERIDPSSGEAIQQQSKLYSASLRNLRQLPVTQKRNTGDVGLPRLNIGRPIVPSPFIVDPDTVPEPDIAMGLMQLFETISIPTDADILMDVEQSIHALYDGTESHTWTGTNSPLPRLQRFEPFSDQDSTVGQPYTPAWAVHLKEGTQFAAAYGAESKDRTTVWYLPQKEIDQLLDNDEFLDEFGPFGVETVIFAIDFREQWEVPLYNTNLNSRMSNSNTGLDAMSAFASAVYSEVADGVYRSRTEGAPVISIENQDNTIDVLISEPSLTDLRSVLLGSPDLFDRGQIGRLPPMNNTGVIYLCPEFAEIGNIACRKTSSDQLR